MIKKLVSVICPVFNAAQYIEATIKSILSQSYSNIEFIVVDGSSTDGTLEIISRYRHLLAEVISEPDNGMYDALIKGFKAASGEIVCYINAGDFLNSYAIEVAVDVFNNPEVTWITGFRSICNQQNVVTHVDLPFRYKQSLIKTGSYGLKLPFIQQESTFWRKSLLKEVDFDHLKKLKYAGDYFLWWSFAKTSQLHIVSSPLGVFKKHNGQLSENIESYFKEVKLFANPRKFSHIVQEWIELFFWGLHPKIRSLFFNTVIQYDHKNQQWVNKS